jgi:hypothetical protein
LTFRQRGVRKKIYAEIIEADVRVGYRVAAAAVSVTVQLSEK